MRLGRVWITSAAAMAALLSPLAFHAQTPGVAIESRGKDDAKRADRPDIRIDSNLVLIPVSVTDSMGRPVAGLDKEHFSIRDNKTKQNITSFSMDNGPVALGLVLDTSNSMGPVLATAQRAAALFIETANPGDQFLLVEFDDRPRLTVPLTEDLTNVRYELSSNQSRGATALIDAVYMAMHEIKKSPNERKALIVVSDGGDNNSRYSREELRTLMEESGVLIYGVAVLNDNFETNPGFLRDLANETGGRAFEVNRGLPDIAAKISVDLRNRYVLGYVPANAARDGLYHKVEVELHPPRGLSKLTTHWRRGYYAPAQ